MTRKMFIYELPYSSRKLLCQILDTNDKWEELGGSHMGFDYTYLQYLRRRDSPTDELLTAWGNQNHSVNDLFVLLSKMQHYRAMTLLKEYVQEKFHHLLPEGEELMMSRSPFNKHWMGQGSLSRGGQSVSAQSIAVHDLPFSAARPSCIASPPHTFEDNKDLGLDQYNLNYETPTLKVTGKTVNEVKIQNVQDNVRSKMGNQNNSVQNKVPNGINPTAAGPNVNDQLQAHSQPSTQKPDQERKLSTSSVSSSVMESSMPQIEYEELVAATNGWDKTLLLGQGGFGKVYKGTWKNTLVAIKKLEAQVQNEEVVTNQLVRELRSLNYHRHDNILSLYAYSINDSEACLVYQFMANGSLEDRLLCKQKTAPLNWSHRLNIMTGTARGLQFLHSLGKPPLVHGDIKSANILLDGNFEPRIGDFGLAREGPLQQYTHVKVSRVHGTRPYLPDEFLRGRQFSVKVDTYSFGVVLFEVATGLRAYDENRKEKFLKDHIESFQGRELHRLADPMAGPDLCASASGLLTLGLNCVTARRNDRPDMTNVLNDVIKLYHNYIAALRAISLARQRSLTPTNPLEIQVAFEMQRNPSPIPHLMLQIPQQSIQVGSEMYQLPRDQVVGRDVSPSVNTPPQVDSVCLPEPLNTSPMPLVTLLGKSGPEFLDQQAPTCSAIADQDTTSFHNSSSKSVKMTSEKVSNASFPSRINQMENQMDQNMNESAYLPLVPELQGLKLAGLSISTSTSDA